MGEKSFWFLAAALFFLDGETGDVQFKELSIADAEKAGVTPKERKIYNQEVDKLNAARESIVVEMASRKSESVDEARELWKPYQKSIAPEAFAVVEKTTRATQNALGQK